MRRFFTSLSLPKFSRDGSSVKSRTRLEHPRVAAKVGFASIVVIGVEDAGSGIAVVVELGVPIASGGVPSLRMLIVKGGTFAVLLGLGFPQVLL